MSFYERYEILEKIGAGATAAVYLGWDRKLSRLVAVKSGENKALLTEEAGRQAILKSRFFPALYDLADNGSRVCLIMEYAEGENLADRKKRIGTYTEAEVCMIVIQVAEAMQYLHEEQFVYGDLKPENVIMQSDGRIKVVDLGALLPLAAPGRAEGKDLAETITRGGTISFAAPEQWNEAPDIRNDIYALGRLAQILLTTDGELLCSREMKRLVERCTQKQKEKRYSSMAEVAEVFGTLFSM